MKRIIFSTILMIFGASFGLSVAQSTPVSAACASENGTRLFSIPAWYRGLTDKNCNIKKIDQKGGGESVKIEQFVWTVIGNIMDGLFRIVGVVAVGYIMWAGFQYMIAAGDSGKMAAAKTTITNAVIGLIVALVASAIVQFVMGVF